MRSKDSSCSGNLYRGHQHHSRVVYRRVLRLFDFFLEVICIRMTRNIVHERNRWIHSGHGFIWCTMIRVIPKGTHRYERDTPCTTVVDVKSDNSCLMSLAALGLRAFTFHDRCLSHLNQSTQSTYRISKCYYYPSVTLHFLTLKSYNNITTPIYSVVSAVFMCTYSPWISCDCQFIKASFSFYASELCSPFCRVVLALQQLKTSLLFT